MTRSQGERTARDRGLRLRRLHACPVPDSGRADLAVEREDVEGVELDPRDCACASVQGIEVGDAVDAEHHRLAVDDEMAVPVPRRGLDDPETAVAPVPAVSGRTGARRCRRAEQSGDSRHT